ncbi:hypothetical protein [Klebsiella pneumoniae]|uniref:hypothetical protein n=1 Tax=Klebsiella pneumoniae TaxID=573 RepID=UPI001C04DB18|nr:hypothetical protein [Klebsiella pneumoniae]MBU0049630.1 hypothetical protein [Klebsiella pneumoniae]
MDKSRQQFEEWRSKNKSSTINLFDVWQASRDSLLLNLPEREKSNNGLDRFSIAYNEGISACEQYLLDMGVKIKNE